MTPNDYQQAALRTAPGDLPPERLLLNGLMGLNGAERRSRRSN